MITVMTKYSGVVFNLYGWYKKQPNITDDKLAEKMREILSEMTGEAVDYYRKQIDTHVGGLRRALEADRQL